MKQSARKALEKVIEKRRQWTFEVHGTLNLKGISNYIGKLKDEFGKVIVTIRENEEYNQLSRLLLTSKCMNHERDMTGLARWAWERNLVPMKQEEKDEWNSKKIVPLDIKEVKV